VEEDLRGLDSVPVSFQTTEKHTMNTIESKNAVMKSINAAMETEVGRKILAAKIISLTQDNRNLRRKVAEDRIAVHALNELSFMLTQLVNHSSQLLTDNEIPTDPVSQRLIKTLLAYRNENFGLEMSTRIHSILEDREGDDLLLEDLIGKQPKEEKGENQ